MKLRGQNEDQIDILMNVEDLMLLKRVLHEICNSMYFTDRDFQTIFDAQRTDAQLLLLRMNAIIDRLRLLPDQE
jgi:hypothetical protein